MKIRLSEDNLKELLLKCDKDFHLELVSDIREHLLEKTLREFFEVVPNYNEEKEK